MNQSCFRCPPKWKRHYGTKEIRGLKTKQPAQPAMYFDESGNWHNCNPTANSTMGVQPVSNIPGQQIHSLTYNNLLAVHVIISTQCNHWEQISNPSNICASYGKATTPEAS